MQSTNQHFALFATPFLVFVLFFGFNALNDLIIARDEQARMQVRPIPNTDLIERPQADNSVKIYQRNATGRETLVIHTPPRPKSKGLFKLQYFVFFVVFCVLVSATSFIISLLIAFAHRQRK